MFEFLELLPILTDPARFGADPADAFTVVAPSLPGYGLSFTPGQARFGIEAIANCFAELMTEVLGYGRFGAQGGDWGSFITARLGLAYPDRLSGIHLNMLPVRRDPKMVSNPTREESRYLEELQLWLKEETGYQWIQGTRPQTLAFALTDSPVGLASFFLDKFNEWTYSGGNAEKSLTKDEMLDDISLYWFTDTAVSSAQLYWENNNNNFNVVEQKTREIKVPVAVTVFPGEIYQAPKSWTEKAYPNLIYFNQAKKGGHFASWEEPQVFAQELREAFRSLRK